MNYECCWLKYSSYCPECRGEICLIRLIDANEISKDLEEWKQRPNNDDDAVVLVNHFQGIIRTAPTILESEVMPK